MVRSIVRRTPACALLLLSGLGSVGGFVAISSASRNAKSKISLAPTRSANLALFSELVDSQEATSPSAPPEDDGCTGELATHELASPSPLRYAVLLSVPLVWGTYAPAVKYLYAQPVPMPGILFSTLYYIIALGTLLGITAVAPLLNGSDGGEKYSFAAADEGGGRSGVDGSVGTRSVWSSGAELGAYLFFGNFFQVLGLQWTTADRGAFIVQLTTILVPCLEASVFFTNRPLPTRTWGACLLAAFGVVVFSSDSLAGVSAGGAMTLAESATAILSSLKGDALVAVAAVFYSLHVIRLGSIAPDVAPLRLAVAKAGYETVYALATLAVIGASSTTCLSLAAEALGGTAGADGFLGLWGGGDWLAAHFPPAADVEAFATAVGEGRVTTTEWSAVGTAALWCGVMTCAYTIWAQSFGQRDVRPAEANLIYTSQPIFSAVIAALLLGETFTPRGITGGAIITAALLLSIAPSTPPSEGGEEGGGGGG